MKTPAFLFACVWGPGQPGQPSQPKRKSPKTKNQKNNLNLKSQSQRFPPAELVVTSPSVSTPIWLSPHVTHTLPLADGWYAELQ